MASKKTVATTSALVKGREKFASEFAKMFGEHTLETFEDNKPYTVIPTGSIEYDMALGVGGIVTGRLHEWWGTESIGKTTMALGLVAQAQKLFPSLMCAWVDVERTFDWSWAMANGVDRNRLWLFKPDSSEDVADAVKKLVSDGTIVSLVVLDSIGAMIPEREKEKDANEAVVGIQAKIVTRMVRMAAVDCAEQGTTLLMINQVRANIGYGADTTTGGGWALKHGTTTKTKFRRTSREPLTVGKGESKLEVGHEVAAVIERNKVALPKKTAKFVLLRHDTPQFGPIGVDRADEACRLGISYGLIQQGGAWYTLPETGERLQGREAVLQALRDDPDLVESIRVQLLSIAASNIQAEEIEDLSTVSDEHILSEEIPKFSREERQSEVVGP